MWKHLHSIDAFLSRMLYTYNWYDVESQMIRADASLATSIFFTSDLLVALFARVYDAGPATLSSEPTVPKLPRIRRENAHGEGGCAPLHESAD